MSRFNYPKADFTSGIVEVGAGFTRDQVYATLELTRMDLVGERVPGIGVAGSTLGGSKCNPLVERKISDNFRLSFRTSQYRDQPSITLPDMN